MATNRDRSKKTLEEIDAALWKIYHRAVAAKDNETLQDSDHAMVLLRNLANEIRMEDEKAEQPAA